ncbi:unnamed protein product [Trifolium pratense]|uniref:Uncharacterized protein n=1 Tax=Trifolium pratense TaxID=57577 RepID=A0ACB0IZ38_TRIPR|nr:unnamed protein product [Trifolium pratense]
MDFCFLTILVLVSLVYPINSLETSKHQLVNQTFQQEKEFYKMKKMIATHLQQINKPAVKTIQDPPKRSRGHNQTDNLANNFQLWSLSGESCPDGTIPVRRVTEQDLLRVSSIDEFGKKIVNEYKHQHAVAVVDGGEFYGAKATINLWNPHIESPNEFSLAQIWIVSGTYGKDINTIEAGWQIYPKVYGDYRTRFFIYWTADAYKHTGCYNVKCPGFVQINKNFVIGGTLSPNSRYNGKQVNIKLSIVKCQQTGNWWLELGKGNYLGYWPSSIFTHLKDSATEIHWGGEIANSKYPKATSTQMGSGHFPNEGFKKAAYFRNLKVVDVDENEAPMPQITYLLENTDCYTIMSKNSPKWGDYFYYGGPGRNGKCRLV